MNDHNTSAQLEAVEDQYDSVTDMYRMLTRLCVDKCSKPAPEETFIKVKEGLCLDRCVAKFFATNELISETMKKMQERQQAQMEATQQVQTGGIRSMFGL